MNLDGMTFLRIIELRVGLSYVTFLRLRREYGEVEASSLSCWFLLYTKEEFAEPLSYLSTGIFSMSSSGS
jgi:hypothetical protein